MPLADEVGGIFVSEIVIRYGLKAPFVALFIFADGRKTEKGNKMKFMNNHYGYCQIFHAPDGGSGDAGGTSDDGTDRDDGQDGGDPEEESDEKKFSQKDLDDAVKKRLARERRKWQRDAQKNGKENDGDGDTEQDGESREETKARKAAEDKASALELKVSCYEAGVSKEAVDDVVALARAYMATDEELDMEEAIEKVVKKYPQFKKGAEASGDTEDKKTAWGQRQAGKGSKKLSGVEEEFLRRNPGLKID